jgi:hypothetical protein
MDGRTISRLSSSTLFRTVKNNLFMEHLTQAESLSKVPVLVYFWDAFHHANAVPNLLDKAQPSESYL